MPAPVTMLYAALLGVVAVVLQQLVGRERLRSGVSLYDGGDTRLAEAIRRHANFTEQVPLVLLLMALLELNGLGALVIHGLGGVLLVARIAHPFGLRMEDSRSPVRFLAAVVTVLVLVACIGLALWRFTSG